MLQLCSDTFRIFRDMDPSLAGLLALDPLLNLHGGLRRPLPYFAMGPICRQMPDRLLQIFADQPLIGVDTSPEIMRNFFGWAGGTIWYTMIQEMMFQNLILGYGPYLRGSLPVCENIKVVAIHAEGDPWAPPEGFVDAYAGGTSDIVPNVGMYRFSYASRENDLAKALAAIRNPNIRSLALVLDQTCHSGHLAIAMPGSRHQAFMPDILGAASRVWVPNE